MARHRSNTRARQKPPESPGGMVALVFLLIIGGGGAFFLKQYFDEKREAGLREEMAYEDRKRNEMRDMVARQKQLESKSSQFGQEEMEKRKFEISFDRAIERARSLMLEDEFGVALRVLAELNTDKLTDLQNQRAETLREKINTQALDKFVKIKALALEKADEEDYDGAILIVKMADAFGIPEISNEVQALASNYQKMKTLGKLGNQVQTFTIIGEQLNPSLSVFDYVTARATIERLSPVADYMLFQDDLVGIMGVANFHKKTWGEFKNAMVRRVGAEEMFGIKRGTVKAIDDNGLTLDTAEGEVMLTLKEIQPAWIRAKVELTKEKFPEAHYGLGVMFLHKGQDKDAQAIFTQHAVDDDKNAARHLRWLGWKDEVKAMEVYKTLVAANQQQAFMQVPEIAASLKEEYGNTRLYSQESAKIRQMVDTAARLLAENKEKAEEILARLATFEDKARERLTEWFEEKKSVIERQYQKDLYDEFSYVKRIPYSYSKEIGGGNMRINFDVVLKTLAEIREGGVDVSAASKNQIEKDRRYLEKGVREASLNRESNANLAKRKRIQLSANIKNERMRLERRLKAFELVTDEEIEKKLNVFD
ncbi:MAG: hypothetical protein O2857_11160 [Planctomycetota bacterium]|nr:hypothetical protein [Planctomycetota bacterium]